MDELIHEYEDKSIHICEYNGNPVVSKSLISVEWGGNLSCFTSDGRDAKVCEELNNLEMDRLITEEQPCPFAKMK